MRLFLDKHVIRAPTTRTLTRRNSFENGVVPTAIFKPVTNLSTLNEVSSPTNSCKINDGKNQDTPTSVVMDFHILAPFNSSVTFWVLCDANFGDKLCLPMTATVGID
jgi:hypothetical protein